MTFAQFLAIARARWKSILTVFGLTVALVVIASLLMPKKYTADASVVVQVSPDPISGAISNALLGPSIIATQVDILTSDRVARRVVTDLKFDQNAAVRQQWLEETGGEGTLEGYLVDAFQKRLDVKPSRDSNVITISYKAPDAKFAAVLANAFVHAYLETALELRVDPARQYSGFFDKRILEARATLQAAQTKLSDFQQANGIVGGDERLDVETSRLNDLSAQLVMMQTLATDSTSRNSQAVNGKSETLSDTMNNPVIGGLKVDLNRAEAHLQELGTRLGPNNPQVVETKASINELRARIEAETRRVTGSVGVTASINNARVSQLQAELEAQRSKVLKLKQTRDGMSVLQGDVDAAQKAFDAISQRRTESNLESQTQQTNVNILSEASPPMLPSSPRLLLNTVLAVFLGGVLSIGVALLRELRDRRVRATSDLVVSLGLPILGVLPRPAIVRKSGLQSLMAQRVISGRLGLSGKK
jgi:chain length determinant protein EpsF